MEIHNPSSAELKLKLFHMPNVANSGLAAKRVNLEGGDDALSIGENMKEIVDLESFKAALNNLREAMVAALPWNRSISAIAGFLQNNCYLQEELGSNSKRAAILTEFVDYVLGRNALNWQNKQVFLTADALQHVWSSWKGKQAGLLMGKFESKKKPINDICGRFNRGVCPDQGASECVTSTGLKLRHVCSQFVGPNQKCGQQHARKDHK